MIITLCGSVRFQEDMNEIARRLTALGHCVFKPEAIGVKMDETQKVLIGMVHAQKILRSDEVYIVRGNDYMGASTEAELIFAIRNKIKVAHIFLNGDRLRTTYIPYYVGMVSKSIQPM